MSMSLHFSFFTLVTPALTQCTRNGYQGTVKILQLWFNSGKGSHQPSERSWIFVFSQLSRNHMVLVIAIGNRRLYQPELWLKGIFLDQWSYSSKRLGSILLLAFGLPLSFSAWPMTWDHLVKYTKEQVKESLSFLIIGTRTGVPGKQESLRQLKRGRSL